jgi:hypothetical protein
MDSSDFLPKRSEISREVEAILERRESKRQADSGRKHLDEVAEWKAQWERERAGGAVAQEVAEAT